MHLLSWNNGTASASIREALDDAIRSVISADQRIEITFISVDGDEGYESNFARCFSQIKACLAQLAFRQGKLIKDLIALCPFWISNWLHLLKNARLFSGQICINPLSKSDDASITGLPQYFGKSPTFTDSTSLGKMRDSYPLDLFSLARAFHLQEHHSNDDLFMGFGVEAMENRHFDVEIRGLIIETLLLFALIQESLMEVSGLREKPNA
jgi:hypothetical protein